MASRDRWTTRNNEPRVDVHYMEYACRDSHTFHLKPVMPGESRSVLYCPKCANQNHCIFKHRVIPAEISKLTMPDNGVNDWIRTMDARIVGGDIPRSTLYEAIQSGDLSWWALKEDSAGRLHGYRVSLLEIVARWGCCVSDLKTDDMVDFARDEAEAWWAAHPELKGVESHGYEY